jgi:hypothetical protein
MYKGFKPKALRMAIAGAVSMICFEFVLNIAGNGSGTNAN